MVVTENFSITGDEKKIDELKKYIYKLGSEVKVNDEIEDPDLIENAKNWRKVAKDIKAIKEGRAKTYTKEEFWDIVNN